MANFITAAQAAQLVKDGDTVAFGGFGAYCGPDALLAALGARFRETGAPKNLTSVTGISCGDNSGGEVGMNQVAYEGLLGTIIAGHLGNPPRLGALAAQDKVAAYCLPLGVVMNLYRAIAAKKSGVLTSVGLGTYADPRVEGCKINGKARAQGREVVRLLELGGKAQLFYPAFPINICFIRGSYADEQGNISVEREALTGAELEIAAATRNSGGIVVVQVERIVEGGSLHPRRVRIHRSLVDYAVDAHPPGMEGAAARAMPRPTGRSWTARSAARWTPWSPWSLPCAKSSPAGRPWSCARAVSSTWASACPRGWGAWQTKRASPPCCPWSPAPWGACRWRGWALPRR